MRRLIALLVVWAGLLGAGIPAFACATAAAAGDCCAPGAPAGCGEVYAHLASVDVGAAVAGQLSRDSQIALSDRASPEPIVGVASLAACVDSDRQPHITEPIVGSTSTDAALTYLRTGRLRL